MDNIRKVIDANMYGVIHGVKAVLPHMLKRESGHIVNIASVAAIVPLPLQSVYVAGKCAVRGLTECLRYELAPFNVKVTVVCPAEVATEIFGDPKTYRPTPSASTRPASRFLTALSREGLCRPLWTRPAGSIATPLKILRQTNNSCSKCSTML